MTETNSGTQEASAMAEVVVTVDHVYLPLDEGGNVRTDWAVTNVSTTKVSKRPRLQAPADLTGRKSRSSTPTVCSSNSAPFANRYDKTARNLLAAIHLAAATIWLN
jgi:hypothetical protein